MIFTAPELLIKKNKQTLFLAGSIEMGKAEKWQDTVIADWEISFHYDIYNPRRDDWNDGWTQEYNNLQFRDQVIWEQTAIANADIVAFYFADGTSSPITLLELGQCIGAKKKCIVRCTQDFWRHGNIQIMCHLNGIPLCHDMSQFLELIRNARI
jgi:hypothetical protein